MAMSSYPFGSYNLRNLMQKVIGLVNLRIDKHSIVDYIVWIKKGQTDAGSIPWA